MSLKVKKKNGKELFMHAMLFEAIAIFIITPVAAWIMNKPLMDMGVLAVMVSVIALLWNMLFNFLFEHFETKYGLYRTIKLRLIHVSLFEIGLLSVVVPLGAFWLDISFVKSFMLNIGLVSFFVPYAFIYNLVFDKIRHAMLNKNFDNLEGKTI